MTEQLRLDLPEQGINSVSIPNDMSPKGWLKIMIDNEGDVHLCIFDDENETFSGVEFCNSGTRTSFELRQAIRAVMYQAAKEFPESVTRFE
jgi:hypothetical protein